MRDILLLIILYDIFSPVIKAGNMFLLFPGEWHSCRPNKQTGWEEYWIGFKGENIANRIKHGFFSKQTPVFYIGTLEEVAQLYKIRQ